MQTTTIDIDFEKYKIAHFSGNSTEHNFCHDDIMKMAEKQIEKSKLPKLFIALIPKEKKLTDCHGDDWDDVPADDNASGFYVYPEGTIFLNGKLGGELKLKIAGSN